MNGSSWKRRLPLPRALESAVLVLRSMWRAWRIRRGPTRFLGVQYKPSRQNLEIDITYRCNLRCQNCNRSVRQAYESVDMTSAQLAAWVDEWIDQRHIWRRIRVLGGEPTLHPTFTGLMAQLERYRAFSPRTKIEVVTNGHGPRVNSRLAQLPPHIWVENSNKSGPAQPLFRPFNMAPVDDPGFRDADFSNGCAIMRDCGMGLTPMGYYPCALAGGIDRVAGWGLGRSSLPAVAENLELEAARACSMCGRFRDGHHVPEHLREPLQGEPQSASWVRLYAAWRTGSRARGRRVAP